MFVCCECCVLSLRGFCDELITRTEESYWLCWVVVCDLENLKNEEAMTRVRSQRHSKKVQLFTRLYLRVDKEYFVNNLPSFWLHPIEEYKFTKFRGKVPENIFCSEDNINNWGTDLGFFAQHSNGYMAIRIRTLRRKGLPKNEIFTNLLGSVGRVLVERREVKINFEEIGVLPFGLTSRRTESSGVLCVCVCMCVCVNVCVYVCVCMCVWQQYRRFCSITMW
jgi:hypothetical protein